MKYTLLMLLALCAAPFLSAEIQVNPKAGEPAPNFGECTWAANAPLSDEIEDYRGDVVIVLEWNWKDDDSLAFLIAFQEYYRKNAEKGLHIFAFHRKMPDADDAEHEEIIDLAIKYGLTYPVASKGGSSYTARFRPNAWVVDDTGKVTFADHPRKYNGYATEALKKVLYPGMGTNLIHKDVEKAAEKFVKGEYAKAREEAQEVIDEAENKKAVEDAKHIMDRIDARLKRANESIEAATKLKNFLLVERTQEWIADAFDGADEGNAAENALDALGDDDAADEEIDALEELEKFVLKLQKKKTVYADLLDELKDYAEDDDLKDRYALTLITEALEADNAADYILMHLQPR